MSSSSLAEIHYRLHIITVVFLIVTCQNPTSRLHPRWNWGRCSHANTLCRRRPLGDPGCDGGQVQLRCAVQCGSQVVLLLLPPPPA